MVIYSTMQKVSMSLVNVVVFVISVAVHQGRGQKGSGLWEVISKCDKNYSSGHGIMDYKYRWNLLQ